MRVGGSLVHIKGDWQWMKQAFGLHGWQGEGVRLRCCWKCGVGLRDHACYHADLQAPWRDTCIDMAGFWADMIQEGRYLSPLFSVPGFTVASFEIDWMHACDLGVLQHLLGNIVADLWQKIGATRRQPSCQRLLNLINMMSKSRGEDPPINNLTVLMFWPKSTAYPKIKLKAAEARYMVPVLLMVLQNCFPAETEYEITREQCLAAMCKCLDELKSWEHGYSNIRLGKLARQFVMLYCRLRRMSGDARRWKLVPTFHLFLHCAESATNPRLSWNYCDEAAIGEASAIARVCNFAHLHVAVMRRDRITFRM